MIFNYFKLSFTFLLSAQAVTLLVSLPPTSSSWLRFWTLINIRLVLLSALPTSSCPIQAQGVSSALCSFGYRQLVAPRLLSLLWEGWQSPRSSLRQCRCHCQCLHSWAVQCNIIIIIIKLQLRCWQRLSLQCQQTSRTWLGLQEVSLNREATDRPGIATDIVIDHDNCTCTCQCQHWQCHCSVVNDNKWPMPLSSM